MLDESAKRKPNFDQANSVGITLIDGQVWYVPKPWLEVRPTFKDGRAVRNYPVYTYTPELDALIEAIGDSESSFDQLCATASLAAYLLTRHYDLTDADLDQLLCFRVNDPDSTAWTADVIRVATGRSGPKRARAGGD